MNEPASTTGRRWVFPPRHRSGLLDDHLQRTLMGWVLGDTPGTGIVPTSTAVPDAHADDIVEALSWLRPGWPKLRIVVDGAVVEPGRYLVGAGATWRRSRDLPVDASAVRSLLANGGMLVLDDADQSFPTIGRTAAAIQSVVGHRVWANAYVNTGSGGFQRHSDDHDVLAVVVSGRRTWMFDHATIETTSGMWLAIPQSTGHAADRPSTVPALHVSFSWRRATVGELAAVGGGYEAARAGEPLLRLTDADDTVDARLSGWNVSDTGRWPDGPWGGPVLVHRAGGTVRFAHRGTWHPVTGDTGELPSLPAQ